MTEQNDFAFRKVCKELNLRVDEVETDHIRTKIGDDYYDYYTRTGKVHKIGSKTFHVPQEGIEAFIRSAYEPIRATAEAAREKIKANIVSFRNQPKHEATNKTTETSSTDTGSGIQQ